MTTKYKIIGHSIVFAAVLGLSLSFLFARPASVAADCSASSLGQCSQDQCSGVGGIWGYQGSVMTCHGAADSGSGPSTPNSDASSSTSGFEDIGNVSSDKAASGGDCSNAHNCDFIHNYINPFINFLAALVGVAVTISIIIGAIQYGSSAGDPQAVTAAKNRIRNSIIALLTFIFLWALLNFLIPGGLL